MAWVRAFIAVARATRSERIISTCRSPALGMAALAGQDRSGGGLGIDRVGLAPPAAGLAVGAVDLNHDLALRAQEASQPGPIAAGPFHPAGCHLAKSAGPVQQRPIAARRGRIASWPGDGRTVVGDGDVDIAVGVDPDRDPDRLGCAMVVMAASLLQGGWLLPAERADSTATSLAAQAPVRSRSLGWHCLRVAAAPSRQITAKARGQ